MKWTVPSGEIDTHGSDARAKRLPPGAQLVNGGALRVHVRPPSNDAAASSPLAPPFDHRSCCQTPTM
jgi:hypothetical protein